MNPARRPRPAVAYAETDPAFGTATDMRAYDQAVNDIATVATRKTSATAPLLRASSTPNVPIGAVGPMNSRP